MGKQILRYLCALETIEFYFLGNYAGIFTEYVPEWYLIEGKQQLRSLGVKLCMTKSIKYAYR